MKSNLITRKKNIWIYSVIFVALLFLLRINIKAVDLDTDETMDQLLEDDSNVTIQVSLYESYNAQYDLYEESLNDIYFFYSNVGNGAISSKPVVFDMPKNLNYTVERDGEPVNYVAGEGISENGNYVIRLSADYDNTHYASTFRFSIREGNDSQDNNQTELTEEDLDNMVSDAANNMADEDIYSDADLTDEALDEIVENVGLEFSESGGQTYVNGYPVDEYTGFSQQYDASTGLYNYIFKSGEKVVSNVPNGAIVNSGVSVRMPDAVTATVYRNGEVIDGGSFDFTEDGFYSVVFYCSSVSFERFFPNENNYPRLNFRIVTMAVNDIEVFNAPKGCKIIAVENSEGPILDEDGNGDFYYDSYWINEEDTYIFTVYDEAAGKSYNVEIEYDITKPELEITLTKSSAGLKAATEDVAYVNVYRNGQQIDIKGVTVKGRGNYRIVAYDNAGNYSVYEFSLQDSFNTGSILTILMLVIMAMVGFVYIRLQQTMMKVR